nr:hypothetical protein [Actinomycetales bacterium]
MCRAVKCKTCGRTTWAGCGQHVASVKATVPSSQWCNGQHPEKAGAEKADGRGVFARLFGR